ncbi:MAG: hypothetical protein GY869_08600 [Planctomycetes bacterium]|nr:hypothetical protein [Planctomycetota bacterium]
MKNLKCILTIFILLNTGMLWAQTASLTVQGVLRDGAGKTVVDGNYSMTFTIYDDADNEEWNSGSMNVTVENGVYNVILDSFGNLGFDEDYYIGISVDGTEFPDKIQLTTAPYALALVGTSNKFPAAGTVSIGTVTPESGQALEVKGKAVLRYAQNNSALVISPGSPNYNSDAALYIQAIETGSGTGAPFQIARNARFQTSDNNSYYVVTSDEASRLYFGADNFTYSYADVGSNPINWTNQIQITAAGDVIIYNGYLNYGSNRAWRLIDRDDFEGTEDGWEAFDGPGSTVHRGESSVELDGDGLSYIMDPCCSNNRVLRKGFSIPDDVTRIRLNLVYYFLDSWDDESAWIGVSSAASGNVSTVWHYHYDVLQEGTACNFYGRTDYTDSFKQVSCEIDGGFFAGGTMYVTVGAQLNEGIDNEHYGIDDVEIWVR